MEFRFSAEDEAFRAEVRQFLTEQWTVNEDSFAGTTEELFHHQRALQRKLAERGWFTLAWPQEYGGQGANQIRQAILAEELGRAGAPAFDSGVNLLGPCLMIHGTEEQKGRFLPPIACAEVYWCQGFSEPGAGSDLASLQTRATRDGDDFVLNGQKIWTGGAQFADWIHVLARTDPEAPKHRGISYFMVDMRTPGIAAQPIAQMNGRTRFNQVFFDNVRVPADQLIGEENRGWYAATTTLDFERSGITWVVRVEHLVNRLVAFPREAHHSGPASPQAPALRAALADLQIAVNVARWLAYRVAWMQSAGRVPNAEASMAKVFATELNKRAAGTGINMLGLYGGLGLGATQAPLQGLATFSYLDSASLTIAGGTSEIQRGIIARRGLGLPNS